MYRIKSRIWLEGTDGVFVGEGRIQLLKAIEQEGSLNKAAKSLRMSYKKAWKLIDSINKNAKFPLVETTTGGTGGGGTIITTYGKEVIDKFEKINQNCWLFLEEQLQQESL